MHSTVFLINNGQADASDNIPSFAIDVDRANGNRLVETNLVGVFALCSLHRPFS